MAVNCGIIGLPNVGKSTIFSALTANVVEAANYPFCTIEPNVGMVTVPDVRLEALAGHFRPKKTVYASIECVDIAGLVKGASQGEGLGNRFLAHVREVGVLAHVVRCFEHTDIVHVHNKVDPLSDIETVHIELALADLASVEKRAVRAQKESRMGKSLQKESTLVLRALDTLREYLEMGKAACMAPLSDEERNAVRDMRLLTMKPHLYVCNTDESGMQYGNDFVRAVQEHARVHNTQAIVMCGKFEAELAQLSDVAEQNAFLQELGLRESGRAALARAVYSLMGLRTFFTAGPEECRAWTIRAGLRAPHAAGVIHSDLERGFIRAETYSFDDLASCGSVAKVREANRVR
ncbi:redox-regulated ATPase YchF, partial [Treponema pallidum]